MLLVYTTWPDDETAQKAACTIIGERLAACANILAPMRSLYRWQGAVEVAEEIPVLFKTHEAGGQVLAERLAELHPYAVPAIVILKADAFGPFAAWVQEACAPAEG